MSFESCIKPKWCPGCGNFGILMAVKKAFVALNLKPENVVTVSGIGCSSKIPHFIRSYAFEGLHGRVLPVASGIKLANTNLTVVGFAGDGDAYGLGIGHFVHSCRRNINLTYIVHNNNIYGLTTGQYSPTSPKGSRSKSTPFGSLELPVNPLAVALSAGCSFVARSFAGNPKHLEKMIVEAIKHKGFAFVDVLQPCPSWQKDSFRILKEKVYDLESVNHDCSDFASAMSKSLEIEKLPIGIFFKTEFPCFESQIQVLEKGPLVDQRPLSVDGLLKEFY